MGLKWNVNSDDNGKGKFNRWPSLFAVIKWRQHRFIHEILPSSLYSSSHLIQLSDKLFVSSRRQAQSWNTYLNDIFLCIYFLLLIKMQQHKTLSLGCRNSRTTNHITSFWSKIKEWAWIYFKKKNLQIYRKIKLVASFHSKMYTTKNQIFRIMWTKNRNKI